MSDQQPPFHALSVRRAVQRLDADAERGLGKEEVRDRQKEYGYNELRHVARRSAWTVLLSQFKSIVIALLAMAAAAALATGRIPEGVALLAVVVINTLIGFATEWRALRSMEALRALGRRTCRVRRGGREREVRVETLVPGDVVLLGADDLVPADVRLLQAERLRVNEAALTGESVPVDKRTSAIDADAPLAERANMLFKGTTITEGRAEGLVAATGMRTELGRIAELTEAAEEEVTPLEQRLDRLGRRLAWVTIGIAVVVAAAGLAAGQEAALMIETAIALGVAAIPEGLPIVATIALARGMRLMARRNALINRLAAVETLGATGVILTDKTGTLTENRMSVRLVATAAGDHELRADHGDGDQGDGDPLLLRLLGIATLCNDAATGEREEDARGDPTEVALLEAAEACGISRRSLIERHPEIRDVPFDPDVMMMATYHRWDGSVRIAVKGAPGAVLEASTRVATADGIRDLSDEERGTWRQRVEELAGQGLRVLAFADREAEREDAPAYERLTLVGLAGLVDPPRPGVGAALDECRAAGIRTIMVTGDQADTAAAIGRELGLTGEQDPPPLQGTELADPGALSPAERERVLATRIFARVSPEQKLALVGLFQDAGDVVAMTGDGVNDAPGLKKADIGVAMGRRGTDAARQVADMVLQDDRFATIVAAVRHGRIIFANIRKSVTFMLCTNLAEVLVVTLASLANAPIPLRPLQILYLNVLTDVFPALALGVGLGTAQVMRQPPRPADEAILTRHHWLAIGAWSAVIGTCVLVSLTIALLALGFDEARAVTVSFLTLAFAKLWFVFNLRDRGSSLAANDVVRNPWIWGALALCAPLLLLAVYWPPLAAVLDTRAPGSDGWLLILAISLVPALLGAFLPGIRFHAASPAAGRSASTA